jgi:protein MpaA
VKGSTNALCLGALLVCAMLAWAPATDADTHRELLGRSAHGRPIELHRVGDPRSPNRILVVGCIHGDECAGVPVARRLLQVDAPPDAAFWVVPNLNPDGLAGRHRQNGRGVDLNRNFGAMWRPVGRRWDPQYSGPRPWSEPETRLIRALILRVRPSVTIWFHQPQGLVRAWGPSISAGRRYARLAGERFRALPWPNGTGPNWQNHRFPSTASFVVELAAGPLSPGAVDRHVRAIRRIAL